ncbi:MAG: hypothetical protein KC486_26930 [Myxococcales bacterium]|nr:hypothetical protein [Myxococcales bacterium]
MSGIRWPATVGDRLDLTWEGEGSAATILDAAARAYFEVTGVLAVADAEGIGPALYRRRELAIDGLCGPAALTVELRALGRRSAWMTINWRSAAADGQVERVYCWRDREGRAAAIPGAATIGILALDGERLMARRAPD